MTQNQPVDPAIPGRYIIRGRVVTMDAAFRVLVGGAVYVADGQITAVLPDNAPAPAGFDAQTPSLDTEGTIVPGLIELHNHLAYNALRLWHVPQQYTNRDQWAGIPAYRQLISGPMKAVGNHPELLPALVRYVEAKCLVAGTTTSQGVALFSAPGIRRYYRGIVRNVEQTDESALPASVDRIPDVEATQHDAFRRELDGQTARGGCLLLHLSEGTDQAARNHFLALKGTAGDWAISPGLAGIHCVALEDADITILAGHGGAMVWSPLSNLLLYGQTARVADIKAAGIRIGIGSDWSPSGSKNLLGELKVAHLYAAASTPPIFSDQELLAMATRTAAQILGWKNLGSIEAGNRADLVAITTKSGDPYTALVQATERDISLVMIEGVPRYGTKAVMASLRTPGEAATIAGAERVLNLAQQTENAEVASLSLSAATTILTNALENIPSLAAAPPALAGDSRPRLALDEIEDTDVQLRPRLPLAGESALTGPSPEPVAAPPLPLVALRLDALTIPDDSDYLPTIVAAQNPPSGLGRALSAFY